MISIIDFIANLQNNLNISTNLTHDEVAYINKLLLAESDISGNFGIISQVKMEFNNIIKEDTITLHDIPGLILVITDILKTNIVQNAIHNVGLLNIIKFILDALFYSNLLLLNPNEISLIKSLVDSSLQLLQTNIDFVVKEEQYMCSFFETCDLNFFRYV
jgi:hypothetical protein